MKNGWKHKGFGVTQTLEIRIKNRRAIDMEFQEKVRLEKVITLSALENRTELLVEQLVEWAMQAEGGFMSCMNPEVDMQDYSGWDSFSRYCPVMVLALAKKIERLGFADKFVPFLSWVKGRQEFFSTAKRYLGGGKIFLVSWSVARSRVTTSFEKLQNSNVVSKEAWEIREYSEGSDGFTTVECGTHEEHYHPQDDHVGWGYGDD